MKSSKVVTASLLVAGTAIGAGMLALPVATAQGGFWPAVAVYFLCWIFSSATGLLLLEACLWLPKDSNIVSLSSHLLGRKGKMASWVLYLFFFYCLTIAYVSGGGGLITVLFKDTIPIPLGILIFVLVFSPVVYIGTHAVDRFNFLLMVGLIISFSAFIVIGIGKVDVNILEHAHWPSAFLALPVMLASFSYQGIVPSIRTYFYNEPKTARKVILIGSSLPFFIYLIWEYLILGIVPLEGANGLLAALENGQTAIDPLRQFSQSRTIYAIGQAFAFFALSSSFLGVTLGLFDFLADGLKMKKRGTDKGILFSIVYIPPMVVAMLNPNIFISALSYAGGFGAILLLGLFPILMVWSGRYKKGLPRKDQLWGGKPLLLFLACFVLFEISVQVIDMIKN
ncbi:MAG: Tryptophan-specific transport protein [Chlamydiae bacterium]|nr:Tryptophan-specific transport protein [Chlamydiota bacterium]